MKINIAPNGRVNLKKAEKILRDFQHNIPPDTHYGIIAELFNYLGIDFRSTKEGILVECVLHINFQHRNCRLTIHRKGVSQALKYANTKFLALSSDSAGRSS